MASTIQNRAAWLDGAKKRLRVGPAEMPIAGPNQIVIRNRAVAMNPVDWKVQDAGGFYQHWPNIGGTDIAGEIVDAGEGVRKNLIKGSRVIAHSTNLLSSDPKQGAFQLYSLALADNTAEIPDDLSFADAVVLPLAFDTALIGLCGTNGKGLGLPFPRLKPEPNNKTIVVWGGSSSVGALTTQLAVAGGAKVVAVASERNFDFCRECGASAVVDYHRNTVIEDVVDAVKHTGGEFSGVYDAISLPESYEFVLPILEKLGGGKLSIVLFNAPEDLADNVEKCQVMAANTEFVKPFWEQFISEALKLGQLKCLPKAVVVGHGLDGIQEGIDVQKRGVSARKIVVEL